MKSLWRRIPTGRLEARNLYQQQVGNQSQVTASEFFEPAVIGGSIAASITITAANVNLTALGGEDYIIYRQGQLFNNFYRKTGGGNLIKVSEFDPENLFFLDEEQKAQQFSASDATPAIATFTDYQGRVVSATDSVTYFNTQKSAGVKVQFPAGVGERTASLYVKGFGQNADSMVFDAICSLSDGSAYTVATNSAGVANAEVFYRVDVTYKASTAGQTLTVIFNMRNVATENIRAIHFGAAWVSTESSGSVPTDIALGIATADATGLNAQVERVTAITAGIATANATGLQASLTMPTNITLGLATANATGINALIAQTYNLLLGIATANASGIQVTASVTQNITLGITTANATGYQATITRPTNITANFSTANASGLTANVIRTTNITAGITTADASGLQATVVKSTNITLGLSTADATGLPVSLATATQISLNLATAFAQGLNATVVQTKNITANLATANATGLQSTITRPTNITCGLSTATASGLQANVVKTTNILCNIANAAASGLQVSLVNATNILCGIADANASGLQATIVKTTNILCGISTANASGIPFTVDFGEPIAEASGGLLFYRRKLRR